MSGVITAAVALTVTAGLAYEQNRVARATQREQKTRVAQQEAKIRDEIAFEKRKKQEQDINASRTALRLRTDGATGSPVGGMSGSGLSSPLGGVGMSDKLGL